MAHHKTSLPYQQELEDRLAAYCEIGVKYWKYVFELETNSLLTMNNEDRLRANEGLEQSHSMHF